MAMTTKDFELIAATICANVKEWKAGADAECSTETFKQTCRTRVAALRMTALDLAYRLREGNPRFDFDRFMKACGFKVDDEGRFV